MRVRPQRSARYSKTQFLFAALIPALIVTFSITGFVWASTDVTIVEDGRTRTVTTQASDVAGTLAESGIDLRDADLVVPSRDASVRGGMTIVVRHAKPVTLDLGGERVQVEVVGETVADALVAVGIDPAAHPDVTPAIDQPLQDQTAVSIPDVFVRVVQEEGTRTVPARVVRDTSMPKGSRRTITTGEPATVLMLYRTMVTRGVEGSRTLTAEHVLDAGEPAIIAVGTGPAAGAAQATSRTPGGLAGAPTTGRRMRVECTGYSPQQPDLDYTTATGDRARHGVIAVDPDVIPLGTRVYVPGYGYAIAADTGGAIDGKRIDLCFETVAEARAWGRRSVTIIVLD